MRKVTVFHDNTISVGATITGYYVSQEPDGTKVRAWHNNGFPRPRDLGEKVVMPQRRYWVSGEAGFAAFERDFLSIWDAHAPREAPCSTLN